MSLESLSQAVISNQGTLYVSSGTVVSISGSYIHGGNSADLSIDANGMLTVTGDIINQSASAITNGATGKIELNGTSLQVIDRDALSVNQFHDITLNNPAGAKLNRSLQITNDLDLQQGLFDLDTSRLDLVVDGKVLAETNANRVTTASTGSIRTDLRNFAGGGLTTLVNIANLGAEISIPAFPGGDVIIERRHQQVSANANNESILRSFRITVLDNGGNPYSSNPGQLKLNYHDNELGTIASQEANFTLYQSTDNGLTWVSMGGAPNPVGNAVDLSNITNLNGIWTISYCVPPAVSLGSDIALCPYGSATLTALATGTSPFTYKWFENAVEVAGQTGASLDITVADDEVDYLVVATDAKGCSTQDDLQVTIRTLPAVELGGDVSVCANISAVLDAGAGFSSYKWMDTDDLQIGTNQTFIAGTAGEYKIEISDAFGCKNRDSVNVIHKALPQSNLLPTASTCGDEFILGAGLSDLNAGASYLWRDDQNTTLGTQSTVTVSQDGSYSVTITGSNSCEILASSTVTLNTTDLIDLGVDQEICALSSIPLDATRANSSYLWSTGETTATINYTIGSADVEVWAEITDLTSNCTARDTIMIFAQPLPLVNLGADVTVCENNTATLDAGTGFASYKWVDNSTNQTLVVSMAGTYSVEVSSSFGCKDSDSVGFAFFPPIQFNFTPETATCGTVIELGIGLAAINPGATFLWSNGAVTPTISVTQSGDYSVTVTDVNGCQKTSGTKAVLNVTDFVNLGPDINMACESVNIDAGNAGSTYAWSTGSSTRAISVDKPGTYSVTVTNPFGCVDSDDINVILLPPLDSAFFLSATEAFVRDTIYFIGLTTASTSETIWDFNDGNTLEGNALFSSHQYLSAGEFNPSLTTVFLNGCEDTYAKKVTITELEGDAPSAGRIRGPLITEIVIHPNPNEGQFKVDIILSEESQVRLAIISSIGIHITAPQTIAGRNAYHVEYDLRGVTPGVYLMTIVAGNEGKQYRILVER